MAEKIELEWGQTPWQQMSREELERAMERAYFALVAADSVLSILKDTQVSSGLNMIYWGPNGRGGRALALTREVRRPYDEKYEDGQAYRSYFRTAHGLLFPGVEPNWAVCSSCGRMTSASNDEQTAKQIGQKCYDAGCSGQQVWLTWENSGLLKKEETE